MTTDEQSEGREADEQSRPTRWQVTMPVAPPPAHEPEQSRLEPTEPPATAGGDTGPEAAPGESPARVSDAAEDDAAIPGFVQVALRSHPATGARAEEAVIPLLQDVVVPGRRGSGAQRGEGLAEAILAELVPVLQRSLTSSLQNQAQEIVAKLLQGLRPLIEERVEEALRRSRSEPVRHRGTRGTGSP